jgi:DNA gyrase subunit A
MRAMETREEDFVEQIFIANNHADVLFFSDKGRAYFKKVYEIPEATRTSRGRAIVNFVGMEPGDRVASIVPIRKFNENDDLVTCSKRGLVKRSSLSAYATNRSAGVIGVGIAPGDELLSAAVANESQQVILGTTQGMSIRFDVSEVRRMGREARGVRGIELREGDVVVGMGIIEDQAQQVLSISANGYGKRTPVNEWRVQGRGGIGVIAMDLSERNGAMVNLYLVRLDHEIMVITDAGQLIRTAVSEIREVSRNTQGVRVIRLAGNEHVVDVAPLAERDEDPGNGSCPPPDTTPPPACA